MFRNFRIGWRLLLKQPIYSLAVILGLASGFAACFLLSNYVHYSFSYDAHVPDSQRTYVVQSRFNTMASTWVEAAPMPFLDIAMKTGLVEDGSRVQWLNGVFKNGNNLTRLNLRAVDPSFGKLFGVKLIEGNLADALTQANGLALTQDAAHKLLGGRRSARPDRAPAGHTAPVTGNPGEPTDQHHRPVRSPGRHR